MTTDAPLLSTADRPPRRVRLLTLGCKVNQYETQLVKEALEGAGWREATPEEQADLCVLNTCTVTMEGDAKSRQLVRRLHKQQPHADIVVMGCYATRRPEVLRTLPGVARVVTDKNRLAEDLRPYDVLEMPGGIRRFDDHQRAFVKVQDGCLLDCSYCIIPQVRPGLRSRPVEDIVREVEDLVAGGKREIVLTGIHLGHYGIDLSRGKPREQWSRLWHLLERLGSLPGDFRIRLSSLEAAEARDDLVHALRDVPRVVPHLHLCLQSGSDRILQRMKRRYRVRGFLDRVERIQRALDRPAFTTDVIVGFPGETEEDFRETCRIVREVGFARVHVFSFSPREGTPAASYADRVPAETIAHRRETLRIIERETAETYARTLIGTELDVLIEGFDAGRPGWCVGTSCRYLPVAFPGKDDGRLGERLRIRIQTFGKEELRGEVAGNRFRTGRYSLATCTVSD